MLILFLTSLLLGASAAEGRPPELKGFTVLGVETVEGVEQMEVRYASGDLKVTAFVFLPEGEGPFPLVVFNHGGVSGVSGDMKWRSRLLVEEGYAVITPSYRGEGGSEGNVEVARGEVDDVLTAGRLLGNLPQVDGDRMALVGSSHGALIGVLGAGRRPEGLRCIVSACGVMDVEAWWWWLITHGHSVTDSLTLAVYGRGPQDRPEAFALRRGVRVAGDIEVPVLIQQGLKDGIVPPEQASLLIDAMSAAGRDRWSYAPIPTWGMPSGSGTISATTPNRTSTRRRDPGRTCSCSSRNTCAEDPLGDALADHQDPAHLLSQFRADEDPVDPRGGGPSVESVAIPGQGVIPRSLENPFLPGETAPAHIEHLQGDHRSLPGAHRDRGPIRGGGRPGSTHLEMFPGTIGDGYFGNQDGEFQGGCALVSGVVHRGHTVSIGIPGGDLAVHR
jgi:dienelactone hydrolase